MRIPGFVLESVGLVCAIVVVGERAQGRECSPKSAFSRLDHVVDDHGESGCVAVAVCTASGSAVVWSARLGKEIRPNACHHLIQQASTKAQTHEGRRRESAQETEARCQFRAKFALENGTATGRIWIRRR